MKKKKTFIIILACILVAAFIFSAYKIISYYSQAQRSKNIYNELRELVSESETDNTQETDNTEDLSDEKSDVVLKKYEPIYIRNDDFWGWIKIDGTVIDYPVMHTPSDSEYYLHRGFDKSYLFSGTPFLEGKCFDRCGNYIIYAHHMNDKSMFGMIPQYGDEQFMEEHRIIKLSTLNKTSDYEVIAAFYSKVYSDDKDEFRYYAYTDLTDKDRFDEYVDGVKKNTIYDTNFDVKYGEQLLTLSTCNYHTENGRFVVVAKECN